MIKKVILFLAVTAMSVSALAVEEDTGTGNRSGLLSGTTKGQSRFRGNEGTSAEGIQIGLFIPNYDIKVKQSVGDVSRTDEDGLDDADFGISIGYARYHVRALGFDGSLAYSKLDEENGLLRFGMNVGYAFNSFVHVKAGANVSQITGDTGDISVDPSVGFQIGAGIQVMPNFGLTVGYAVMRQTAKEGLTDFEFTTDGLEAGIVATF